MDVFGFLASCVFSRCYSHSRSSVAAKETCAVSAGRQLTDGARSTPRFSQLCLLLCRTWFPTLHSTVKSRDQRMPPGVHAARFHGGNARPHLRLPCRYPMKG